MYEVKLGLFFLFTFHSHDPTWVSNLNPFSWPRRLNMRQILWSFCCLWQPYTLQQNNTHSSSLVPTFKSKRQNPFRDSAEVTSYSGQLRFFIEKGPFLRLIKPISSRLSVMDYYLSLKRKEMLISFSFPGEWLQFD